MSQKLTKKNSPVFMTMDLLVKLGNLYVDCYILDLSYIVVGDNPSDRILGTLMCQVEQQYKDALKAFTEKDIQCFYVDVVSAKKWLQSLTELLPTEEIKDDFKKYFIEITDKDMIKTIRERAVNIESTFIPEEKDKQPRWWKCVGEDKDLVTSIFNTKAIFNMPIYTPGNDTNPTTIMTISKQVLPLVSEKNIENCYIGTAGKILDDYPSILEVLLWFQFTHFKMMIIYHILILPWVPEGSTESESVETSVDT